MPRFTISIVVRDVIAKSPAEAAVRAFEHITDSQGSFHDFDVLAQLNATGEPVLVDPDDIHKEIGDF